MAERRRHLGRRIALASAGGLAAVAFGAGPAILSAEAATLNVTSAPTAVNLVDYRTPTIQVTGERGTVVFTGTTKPAVAEQPAATESLTQPSQTLGLIEGAVATVAVEALLAGWLAGQTRRNQGLNDRSESPLLKNSKVLSPRAISKASQVALASSVQIGLAAAWLSAIH